MNSTRAVDRTAPRGETSHPSAPCDRRTPALRSQQDRQPTPRLTKPCPPPIYPRIHLEDIATAGARTAGVSAMKVRNSLKSLRSRHRNNQLVRRRGRVYVINKTQRRFKARQG